MGWNRSHCTNTNLKFFMIFFMRLLRNTNLLFPSQYKSLVSKGHLDYLVLLGLGKFRKMKQHGIQWHNYARRRLLDWYCGCWNRHLPHLLLVLKIVYPDILIPDRPFITFELLEKLNMWNHFSRTFTNCSFSFLIVLILFLTSCICCILSFTVILFCFYFSIWSQLRKRCAFRNIWSFQATFNLTSPGSYLFCLYVNIYQSKILQ